MSVQTQKVVRLPSAQVRAAIVANSFDAEKRTIDVVWSTGARGARWDWDIGRYYEELSMQPEHVKLDRLNAGASVLNAHQSYDLTSVIGSVVPGSAEVDGSEGRATILLSEREDIAGIVNDIIKGIIRFLSVGYNVARYELVDKVQEGEDLIPVYRAVDWEPAEISFVPIPFDSGAQSRSGEKGEGVQCIFVNRGAAASEGENMTPEEIEAKRLADEAAAKQRKAEHEAETKRAAEAAKAAEKQRQADIRTVAEVLPEASRSAFVQKHIDGDSAVGAVREEAINELAKAQAGVRGVSRVETVEDEKDKFVRGAGEWLIMRSGVASKIGKAGENLNPGEFRGMSLVELARFCLERRGVNTRGMDKMRMVGEAMTYRDGGYHSSSDFALLLENTMHKVLQAAYDITPDTWRRFAGIGTVSDFRAHNRYMMGSFGALDSKLENGEFKNKQIPDAEKQSVTIGTKGNIIGLTREAIINDDMDAFSRLAVMLGRAAALSIEKDTYAALALNGGLGPTLSDGNPLFFARANRNNVSTGSALSAAAIDGDRQTMAQMMDISGNDYVDLLPSVLLVPLSLGSTARTINGAEYDPDTVANKSQLKPNVVRGLFRDVVDTPRLSGTRRYLFADPTIAPALEVSFLDGQQSPVMETQEGWRVDGVEWKIRHDYAVSGVGYYGAVTNAGA